MVVEEIVREGEPLNVVLAVQQTVVAVFMGRITVEKLAVVNPNMTAEVLGGTGVVSLNTYAIRVANSFLSTITPSNN